MTCNNILIEENKPMPRTCKECGLGPCKWTKSVNFIASCNMPPLRQRLENYGAYVNFCNSGKIEMEEIRLVDARKITDAIATLAYPHREILICAFVKMMHPSEICLYIPLHSRPASVFVDAFKAAEKALEEALKNG